MGNLGSVVNMFKRINIKTKVTNDKNDILNSNKIILPGVGSFDKAMYNLKSSNLIEILKEFAQNKNKYIMGICLGMQLLTNGSDEGIEKGLGLINAYTHKFKFKDNTYKIPHMGWNYVKKNIDNEILKNFDDKFKYYFVHSYYVKVKNEENSLLKTQYENIIFDSGIVNNNIIGFQFHPEKSHKYGFQLFENFAKL